MARGKRTRATARGEGVGSYSYTTAPDTWEWSDAVYAIHGFRRGEVVPTLSLLLAHAQAGDRGQVNALIESCLRDGQLFSFLYRLIDAGGTLRWALIAGEGLFGAEHDVSGLRGYVVDLTEPQARARSQELATAMRRAVASRATIEQAKGALMLAYGLDAGAAFALLSWQSQHANVKLRDLAERLVAAVTGDSLAPASLRQQLDEIIYGLPAAMPDTAPAPDTAVGAMSVPGGGETDGSRPDLLQISQETREGAILLTLAGEVDMATGPRLDKYLAGAVSAAVPPANVVIDLSSVRHLGSVGVSLLASYHRRCRAAGTPLLIVSGERPAARIPATGTGFDIFPRLSDALATLSGDTPHRRSISAHGQISAKRRALCLPDAPIHCMLSVLLNLPRLLEGAGRLGRGGRNACEDCFCRGAARCYLRRFGDACQPNVGGRKAGGSAGAQPRVRRILRERCELPFRPGPGHPSARGEFLERDRSFPAVGSVAVQSPGARPWPGPPQRERAFLAGGHRVQREDQDLGLWHRRAEAAALPGPAPRVAKRVGELRARQEREAQHLLRRIDRVRSVRRAARRRGEALALDTAR
jgi:anti-anti-sigma factor